MELVQETILPLKSINKLNSIFYVLILIFCFCIYNHRTTKTNQKYPSVNL